jgi:hypothetical protein
VLAEAVSVGALGSMRVAARLALPTHLPIHHGESP